MPGKFEAPRGGARRNPQSCSRQSRSGGKGRQEAERCILVDGQWEGLAGTKGRLLDMAKEALSGKEGGEDGHV